MVNFMRSLVVFPQYQRDFPIEHEVLVVIFKHNVLSFFFFGIVSLMHLNTKWMTRWSFSMPIETHVAYRSSLGLGEEHVPSVPNFS